MTALSVDDSDDCIVLVFRRPGGLDDGITLFFRRQGGLLA